LNFLSRWPGRPPDNDILGIPISGRAVSLAVAQNLRAENQFEQFLRDSFQQNGLNHGDSGLAHSVRRAALCVQNRSRAALCLKTTKTAAGEQ
jgi:hypothetical protein